MDVMLKLNCPHCGGKLKLSVFSNRTTCEYCGQDSLITGIVSAQSNCPICNDKDQVKRVSALMQTDDPIRQHVRPPDKPKIPTFDQYCWHKGITDTPLPAREFKKKDLTPFIVIGVICLFAMLIFFANAADKYDVTVNIILGFVFLAAAGVMGYIIFRRASYNSATFKVQEAEYQEKISQLRSEKEKNTSGLRDEYEQMAKDTVENWKLAMKRWELLYYCHRDHIIYIPGADHHVEVKDILKYLYARDM